ncbi:N-acetyltransferase [Corallococcus sp. CA047B]|uniref:GNAT family N-acetyltransferase n=1 Tax=Corallococcus sp. CA047B TaxID=2316729 RepID=UPI000EA30334|nr:GNAT family N-acetyltransferase [Corallococcus sp. CA047B]RKH10720.1 N-acetyltransferase [Corallococcus sp. CA047B]
MSSSSATLSLPEVPAPFLLRPLSMADADGIISLYSDEEVARSLNFAVPVRPETIRTKLAVDLEVMRRGESFRWVLSSQEDTSALGYLTLFNWSVKDRRAEVGYMVARKLWGQGVMKAILPGLVRFGFEQMGLHRMEALVSVENPASLRVLTRGGFRQEGVLRGYRPSGTGDGFVDMIMLSMLETEWREAVAK